MAMRYFLWTAVMGNEMPEKRDPNDRIKGARYRVSNEQKPKDEGGTREWLELANKSQNVHKDRISFKYGCCFVGGVSSVSIVDLYVVG
jgi:hypothetical protein